MLKLRRLPAHATPLLLSLAFAAFLAHRARAAVTRNADEITLGTARYSIAFDAKNGAITRVEEKGKRGSIWRSGEHGLWRVRFRDNSEINAAAFSAASQSNRFSATPDAKNNAVNLRYQSAEIEVNVRVLARAGGAEFTSQITPKSKTVLDFYLPARMRFTPQSVKKFVFPMNGNQGIGIGFKKSFFDRQPENNTLAWGNRTSGAAGYTQLFGAPPQQREDNAAPVNLTVTDAGREWLGADLSDLIKNETASVNRAPAQGQADLTLIDSPNGAYLSASHLGGSGYLWRVGGFVGRERTITVPSITAIVARLAQTAASTRTGTKPKIGLLDVVGGPPTGAGSDAPIATWRDALNALDVVRDGRVQLVSLRNSPEIAAAMRDQSFALILNPYGELLPVPRENALGEVVAQIGDYVRGGGNWFEVGGYSFYTELAPARYLDYFLPYPAALADFVHLDSSSGEAAIYGVQPRRGAPFSNASTRASLFVPGKLHCGGDERGGYSERAFGTWVESGNTWRAPMVFMGIGGNASTRIRDYCAQNAITQRMEDKMSPQLLARFKRAPLIYLDGSARQKIDGIALLPSGSLVHFADYLRYGFDRGLPDMLPPNAQFGTMAEMKELFAKLKAANHLVMPYTNTTWWSNPRGETFTRYGEEGLLKLPPDNRLSYERYGTNDGYTNSPWHPAARAASREVVRQFIEDVPVDVLFQDQVGARSWIMSDWLYDMNPASPTPYAYVDGLLSQGEEDAKRAPLSTESGWDKVINFEAQMCGFTFHIMPSEGYAAPVFWTQFPADTEMFPLIQLMAHDKAALHYHDLGQFVIGQENLSWMFGLGFGVNAKTNSGALRQDASRQWLLWLNQVQKIIVARYTGTPMTAWQHVRGADAKRKGLIRATYGDVKVVANLDDASTRDGARELPPFGFYVTAPGLVAGTLPQKEGAAPFIAQTKNGKTELWIYATEARPVEVELPPSAARATNFQWKNDGAKKGEAAQSIALAPVASTRSVTPTSADVKSVNTRNSKNAKQMAASTRGARFTVSLPRRNNVQSIAPAADLAGKAPLQWDAKPAIGVIDFGADIKPTWTNISVDDWISAFRASRLATQNGVIVERLTTPAQVAAALKAGARRYLTLVNPYGEVFPSLGANPRESLGLIKAYVQSGGNWWETAGHSFYVAAKPDGDGWKTEAIGPTGLSEIGLPIASGGVEQPAEQLKLGESAKTWLSDLASTRVMQNSSSVNRGLPRGVLDPGHVTLVSGRDGDFIGGYRFNGWGYLWRIGGFSPNPQVAIPVVVSATEHLYENAPAPRAASPVSALWHLTQQ